MKASRTCKNSLVLIAAVLGLLQSVALGQSRRSVSLTSPRTVGQLGSSAASNYLSSSGVGGLYNRSGGGGGQGILSVNLNVLSVGGSSQTGGVLSVSQPNPLTASTPGPLGGMGVTRRVDNPLSGTGIYGGIPTGSSPPPVGVAALPSALPALPAAGGRTKETAPQDVQMYDAPGMGRLLGRVDSSALGATRAYLLALEAASASRLKDHSKPITSLVPQQPSLYRDHMAKGDTAFRADNFHIAISEFQTAYDFNSRDAESLICLLHGQFAVSHYSYGKPAFYLQKALECMPELPLANLRPEGFFRARSVYAERIVALEDFAAQNPKDYEAQLILAYFRWFSEARDVKSAVAAVRAAYKAAAAKDDRLMAEAARTFWDGMVASGAVNGELVPATQPAAAKAAAKP